MSNSERSQLIQYVKFINTLSSDFLSSALLNAGYKVSSTHCSKEGVKTDAPSHVMWDIMKGWVRTMAGHMHLFYVNM
jgi:tRNA G26 N,N-dimethylase Trm1